MAAAPVEASSLSLLTAIAGNPPRYPRNPAEQKRDPLVLYIARVPGSRDIVLTPLKPDLKNLKEIDVNACLYYIHRNLESDAALLEPAEQQPKPHQEPQIARKPLPKVSPVHALQQEKQETAELQALNEARASFLEANKSSTQLTPDRPSDNDRLKSTDNLSLAPTISRRAVGFADGVGNSPENSSPVSRRPLGPRPISTGPIFQNDDRRDISPYGNDLQQSISHRPPNANDEARVRANSLLPPPPQPPRPTSSQPESRPESRPTSSGPPTGPPTPPDHKYSLTLIRRDPQSGGQWNVGTIYGLCTASQHQASPMNFQRSALDTSISIHLGTQGYHQFTSTPMKGFQREIVTQWEGFWDHTFGMKKHRRGSSSANNSYPNSRGHSREPSDVSNSSAQYAFTAPSSPQKKQSKMKSYTMVSPWNGRCDFVTAAGGRSLKCKHTLNSNVAARTNHEGGQTPELAVTVSELRYNLPSVQIKVPEKGLEALQMSKEAASKALKRTSKLVSSWTSSRRRSSRESSDSLPPYLKPQLPPRPSNVGSTMDGSSQSRPHLPARPVSTKSATNFSDFVNSDEEAVEDELDPEDEWDRLDLSLGREKAGGGNRGKRAKLGKLIVYDEGFKMLDLVVAANMGIWWAGWETDS